MGTGAEIASPVDSDGMYPPNSNCSWVIQAPEPTQTVTFTFTNFILEDATGCSYDSLSFYNSDTVDPANLIGTYCGESTPESITSSGAVMFISFTSDYCVQHEGFNGIVSFGNEEPTEAQAESDRWWWSYSNYDSLSSSDSMSYSDYMGSGSGDYVSSSDYMGSDSGDYASSSDYMGSGSGNYMGSGSGSGNFMGSGSGFGNFMGSGSGFGNFMGSGSGSGPGNFMGSGSGSGSGNFMGSGSSSGDFMGSGSRPTTTARPKTTNTMINWSSPAKKSKKEMDEAALKRDLAEVLRKGAQHSRKLVEFFRAVNPQQRPLFTTLAIAAATGAATAVGGNAANSVWSWFG